MDSQKEFYCSKYRRHYFCKNVDRRTMSDILTNTNTYVKYNTVNNTGATIKHPYFCPIGRNCIHCRDNGKGKMKTRISRYMFD